MDLCYSYSTFLLMLSSITLALGNCLNYGAMKSLPQELCTSYSCGLASSQALTILAIYVFLFFEVATIKYFLPLALLTPLKFMS